MIVESSVLVLIFVSIAVFQFMLALGFPLGEYALGGFHITLPKKLRIVSIINSIILLGMAMWVLNKMGLIAMVDDSTLQTILIFMTGFMGINTLINALSKSKKEKYVMTPISFIAFICLIILVSN